MAPWQRVPTEIRLEIWEAVTRAYLEERRDLRIRLGAIKSRNEIARTLSACAAVCRGWQTFFERNTFQRLVINDCDVDDFARVVRGKRKMRLAYIQNLRLHIRLDDYDASLGEQPETSRTSWRNDSICVTALLKLLDVLSMCGEPEVTNSRYGIFLELSATSWSDAYHFRNFRMHRDYPYEYKGDLDSDYMAYHYKQSSVEAQTEYGAPRHIIYAGAVRHVLGHMPLGSSCELPVKWEWDGSDFRWKRERELDIVRGFKIRRRFHRLISANMLSWMLACKLQRVCEIHLEQWCPRTLHDFARQVADVPLSSSVKALHLFLDTDIYFQFRPGSLTSISQVKKNAATLATASRGLECITLSFVVETTDFFRAGERSGGLTDRLWPWLRYIAVTDSSLAPGKPGHRALVAAGLMALEMPKLKIMELWHTQPCDACFFRYESDPPKITIAATWDVRSLLTRSCVKVWTNTAETVSRQPLRISAFRLPASTCTPLAFHCRLLRFLRLRNMIVDPVSRFQMEAEGEAAHRAPWRV